MVSGLMRLGLCWGQEGWHGRLFKDRSGLDCICHIQEEEEIIKALLEMSCSCCRYFKSHYTIAV